MTSIGEPVPALDDAQTWLKPTPALAQHLLGVTKELFDLGAKLDTECSLPLRSLITDGFSLEQIWEELQLQNEPFAQHAEEAAKLLAKRKRIELLEASKRLQREKEKAKATAKMQAKRSAAAAAAPADDSEEDARGSETSDRDGEEDGVSDGASASDDYDEDADDVDMSMSGSGSGEDSEIGDNVETDEDEDNGEGTGGSEGEAEGERQGLDGDEDESAAGDAEADDSADDSLADIDELDLGDDEEGDEDVDGAAESDMEEILSTHRVESMKLARQIAELESRQLGSKPWTMTGEVTSKQRPKDSLLEADIEFDQPARPAPLVTQEATTQLEEIIKRRVLDGAFDDVERRAPPELAARKPVVPELDSEKSQKGLAEVYEEEYLKQSGTLQPEAKIRRAHDEIRALFRELCYKLDALTNFRFTPKPPAPEVSIRTNAPAITMEEALPVAVSAASLLAPEEVHARPRKEIKGETERDRAERKAERRERKRQHQKKRQQKEEQRKLLERLRPGAKRPSVKQAAAELQRQKKSGAHKGLLEARAATGPANVWHKLQDEQRARAGTAPAAAAAASAATSAAGKVGKKSAAPLTSYIKL